MNKWQLITSAGYTLGIKEAVTPIMAVFKYRKEMHHEDKYYDDIYGFKVDGNKINFVNKKVII